MSLPTDPTGNVDWAAAGAQQLQQDTTEQLRSSVSQALPVNPDAEAQTRRYAAAAGVPLPTARAMPDDVKLQAQMSTFDADLLARKFPTTTKLLSDPDLAKLTHDDIPATAKVEQAVQSLAGDGQIGDALDQRAAKYIFSYPGADRTLAGDVGDMGMALLKGLGGSFNSAAASVNQVLSVVPILADKVAGGTTAQDWWFRNTLDKNVANAPAYEVGQNATFAAKASHTAGNMAGMLSQIALTGGGAAAPRAVASEGTAAWRARVAMGSQLPYQAVPVILPTIEHGIKAMAFPALADSVNLGRQVYQETNDPAAALRAAAAQWLSTSAMGVVPLSAAGSLAVRIPTGAVSGTATGSIQGAPAA